MEKRVTFNNRLLPYALVAPQMLVTAIFFFWPAGQAIYQSAFIPDPFGLRSLFVGFGNFELRDKCARPGRNPRTGEEVTISARRVVTFKPGEKLKDRVKQQEPPPE